MKLRISVEGIGGETRDVTICSDVTATVGDVARKLILSGLAADPQLEETAQRRLAPVTLLGREAGEGRPVLLDPMAAIAGSGLQSGWTVRPVDEFGADAGAGRLIPATGFIEVCSGPQRGARFSFIAGDNVIGRDRSCRIHLVEHSVSRRHAVITVLPDGTTTIRDLGSANGLQIDGHRVHEKAIEHPRELRFGEVRLKIIPGAPTVESPVLSFAATHIRSPRIVPRLPTSRRQLPSPPIRQTGSGVPLLAMLSPVLMGLTMYLFTGSAMSLIMVAFSPVMMIGSWLDGKLLGRRRYRRDLLKYRETLAEERAHLAADRAREAEIRATETPTLEEIGTAISERTPLLWTRRAEHRSFLELRLGEGTLRSRVELVLPQRGASERAQWRELESMADDYRDIESVPVIERLARCGSIGVAGHSVWAESMARSLVLQLIGLHSPRELALSCFAGIRHRSEWDWLKWVPHVDAVGSPIPVGQLAESPGSGSRLIAALESVLEARSSAQRIVRSHLDADTRNDADQGEGVQDLPSLPAVIVLVLEPGIVDPARLIDLAEAGPDVGIHLIWVAETIGRLPAACRTYLEFGSDRTTDVRGARSRPSSEAGWRAGFVRTSTVVPLSRAELLDAPLAACLARRLASVEDAAARPLDESDLPRTVGLRELHETDLLGGADAIREAWRRSGSIMSDWRSGEERGPVSLAAIVGQASDEAAVIDLRLHGPHALVGGTTGAGKSEFLQSWIMSLAARVSPERLTFLMIDYKGGAAFAECVDLPHAVGLVTDLSPHLVRRALTSLRAEIRYREELLARHGAKDLLAMERRSDPAAPPALVIVIDEFAALMNEIPEFIDGVIDVAQRGRSLGLHLIMATQRPAGVVSDNLRANTNLRIALRMADESDSIDVIGVPDAAFFDAENPGRGAIKIGPGRLSHFQAGYLGGRTSDSAGDPEVVVRPLDFVEGEPMRIPDDGPRRSGGAPSPRDIERLRDGIVAAAEHGALRRPRRPWFDELPRVVGLRDLRTRAGGSACRIGDRGPLVALRDDPSAQAQYPVSIDFGAVGSVAFIGAGGTGKTSALLTLASALSAASPEERVWIYGIDAAGGVLDALRALPTVGAVAPLADTELVLRILRRLREIIAERGPRFAAERAESLEAYRDAERGEREEARVLLLLDGFSVFRQTTDAPGPLAPAFEMLSEIIATGRSVGVHVVLTSDRANAIPAGMAGGVQQQFVFRLSNPYDYGQLDVDGEALQIAPPGRAICAGDERELQFAVAGDRDDLASQVASLEALAGRLRTEGSPGAPEVVNAPVVLELSELPTAVAHADGGEERGEIRPVYGIDTRDFAPVTLPVDGLCVVTGPSGSGLSAAAGACGDALERWCARHDTQLDKVLLTFAENGLRRRSGWTSVAFGEEEVAALAARLARALGGRSASRGAEGLLPHSLLDPSPGATENRAEDPAREAPVFPRPGSRGIIVVERSGDSEETSALPHLVALAKAARRAQVLVLFELEAGRAPGAWELQSALRQHRWGLSLQPDAADTQTLFREDLGRVNRADFPPGRGFAIENGRITPVHVAISRSEAAAL